MITKAHPETHICLRVVGRKRVHLVVAGLVGAAGSNDRQLPVVTSLEHLLLFPLLVFPVVDDAGEFAEIDLGVEVSGKVLAVRARVDVHDVDGLHFVHVFVDRKARKRVHHTRVKARTQNGGHALLGAQVTLFPLIVGVPRRGLANFGRVFVNSGVDIGRTGFDAGIHDGHVHKGRADVDHDLRAGLVDQRCNSRAVHRVNLMGFQNALLLHRALLTDRLKDRLAFGKRPACDMDITKHIVILRAFMRHDLSDATSADDEYVLFQRIEPPCLCV